MIAEDLEANPLLVKAVELAPDVEAEQAGEVADLLRRAPPILRGESVEGQAFDPRLAGGAQHRAGGLGAGAVAGGARQAPRLRPAAVAVHDDGDVARGTERAVRPGAGRLGGHFCRISLSLAARTWSISAIVVVGQLLDLGVEPLVLVLADLVLLLVGLERVHAVAADVADRDPRLFGILVGELGELLAALLGQIGDRQADVLAVDDRIDAEPGIADRLFDRADIRPVPDLDREQARLGHGDGRDLVERHVGAIDLDVDRLDQRGRGAARAQAAEIVLQRLDRAVHPALQVRLVIGRHLISPSFWTIVAVPPPPSTRARLPCSRTLNTTIGMLLSRQSATAVASITFRLSDRT